MKKSQDIYSFVRITFNMAIEHYLVVGPTFKIGDDEDSDDEDDSEDFESDEEEDEDE